MVNTNNHNGTNGTGTGGNGNTNGHENGGGNSNGNAPKPDSKENDHPSVVSLAQYQRWFREAAELHTLLSDPDGPEVGDDAVIIKGAFKRRLLLIERAVRVNILTDIAHFSAGEGYSLVGEVWLVRQKLRAAVDAKEDTTDEEVLAEILKRLNALRDK